MEPRIHCGNGAGWRPRGDGPAGGPEGGPPGSNPAGVPIGRGAWRGHAPPTAAGPRSSGPHTHARAAAIPSGVCPAQLATPPTHGGRHSPPLIEVPRRHACRPCSPRWKPCAPSCLAPHCAAAAPLSGEASAALLEWGVLQVALGKHLAEWRQPSRAEVLAHVILVGCTVHEAHLAAAAVFAAHDAATVVTALVHIQGGNRASPTVLGLLQAV